MSTARSARMATAVGLLTMLLGAMLAIAPGAGATKGNPDHKVTICHRTNSVTNPYEVIDVDYSAADGTIAHGPDHYNHLGGVFDFDAPDAPGYETTYPTPRNGDQWGDIIPPVPLAAGGMTTGLNWTAEGQAIWDADCEEPDVPPAHGVTIAKTNNANGTGDFTPDETAPAQGADVPFRLVITNSGTDPLTVESLVDDWPGGSTPNLDLLTFEGLECTTGTGEATVAFPMASGAVIPVGTVVTCEFTVDDYAPAAGQSVTNTVTLGTAQVADVSDTSIVRTPGGFIPPPQPTYSLDVDKVNDADGDGDFADTEFAAAEGDDVEFRIEIRNTGDATTLSSLVDAFDGTTVDLLGAGVDLECTRSGTAVALTAGSLLPAASTTTCTFTLADYAPAPGTLTNTVTVDTAQTAPQSDDSTVIVVEVLPTPTYGLEVVKDNDANRDGTFGNDESVTAAGQDVTFRLTIRNTGTGPLVLESLADEFGGETVDLLGDIELDCGAVELAVGSTLEPGSETTCTFVLAGYAPDAGDSLENTVTVVTDEVEVDDTSIVRTPEVQGQTIVRPDVQQLPRTGADSNGLTVAGLGLVLFGLALVVGSRQWGTP